MSDYMVEGACKFCGQTQVLKCSDNLTGTAADEWITERCKCPEAQSMRAFNAIAGSVDEVLGDGAVELGFAPVDERTVDLVTEICRAAYSELCGKVMMVLPCGDKLAIAPHMTPNDSVFVTIKRQQKKELGR
jgi:hypothetical protein